MNEAGRELFDCRGSERAVSRGKRTISPISTLSTPYQDKGEGEFCPVARAWGLWDGKKGHATGRRDVPPARGRRYNRAKKTIGKPAGTIMGQNDPISTAGRPTRAGEKGDQVRFSRRRERTPYARGGEGPGLSRLKTIFIYFHAGGLKRL